ncbi:YigZ family protein [Lacrimispora algidixylanolytica]|uniref:YigZ family protein n=1 Tax=Lacrimispora algidixylanolytica TaxID=94868 RepID=A0A419SVU3_9FIRM|nr:YigZ family protein [Lacrimispora algidixylanolytica]RKD29339.1 YigZ family protein [Lacrimispora algidixylanolytica]
MRQAYRVLYEGAVGEITEKKSRFIATFRPVKSEVEAMAFIDELRKKYWDASHNCYAWVIGKNGEEKRSSDDGEPSQTAGKPMLEVLEREKIVNICVVVTRYFGGTLLGTGGLVRAYSSAVKEGLESCTILTVEPAKKISITTDYNGIGKIHYILLQQEMKILESEYTDKVGLIVLVPDEKIVSLEAEITEVTSGKAAILELEDVYYSMLEKEAILFNI